MLNVVDIEKLAQIAHQCGALLAVDNTFATPHLQCPLDLGAGLAMHSGTKYLGRHSDVVIGGLVVKEAGLVEILYFNLFAGGAVAGPQDCFLTLRGIKTLHLRMQRHCENAMKVAQFLVEQPEVAAVFYPGLSDHKGHAVARAQMSSFGGMFFFRLLQNLKLFTLTESLGSVESLANYPNIMTHASIPQAKRLLPIL